MKCYTFWLLFSNNPFVKMKTSQTCLVRIQGFKSLSATRSFFFYQIISLCLPSKSFQSIRQGSWDGWETWLPGMGYWRVWGVFHSESKFLYTPTPFPTTSNHSYFSNIKVLSLSFGGFCLLLTLQNERGFPKGGKILWAHTVIPTLL